MELGLIYEYLKDDLAAVRALLGRELVTGNGPFDKMLGYIRTSEGKMLRSMLVLLGGRACGGTRKAHITLAAVVELVHQATLIHDDVLDDAQQRRHRPSFHVMEGMEAAVLLGDYLFSKAYGLGSGLERLEVNRALAGVTTMICEGEITQLLQRGNWEMTEAAYMEIIGKKTASLMALSCRLGGMAAGGDEPRPARLWDLGWNLGLAFQIKDDVMDLAGEERVLGKTLGSDWKKGKVTLPLIHFFREGGRRARDEAGVKMKEVEEGRQRLRVMLREAGSFAYAQEKAAFYVEQARQCLSGMEAGKPTEMMEVLIGQIQYSFGQEESSRFDLTKETR